jgi:hypothetical protein
LSHPVMPPHPLVPSCPSSLRCPTPRLLLRLVPMLCVITVPVVNKVAFH